MERTVPSTASEEIELYLRTIYSLLRSTTEVQIRTLEEVHAGTNSSLHPDARRMEPDTSAFIYAMLRLPEVLPSVKSIVLGQSYAVFAQHGYAEIERWEPVSGRARRRRCFYNGSDTLACFISSRSDIDDVVPSLAAYQIEWNKLHDLLQRVPDDLLCDEGIHRQTAFARLARLLEMPVEDLERLRTLWGAQFCHMLATISQKRCSLGVRLLSGSLSEYWRATRTWWDTVELAQPDFLSRPVYFVSSNPHSLPNLLSGFARQNLPALETYLALPENAGLLAEWQDTARIVNPSPRENFLYYGLKKMEALPDGDRLAQARIAAEQAHGIQRISNLQTLDIEAQTIELSRLDPSDFDPRLLDGGADWDFLRRSDALILNIDYPLGLAAYNLLAKVAEHTGSIQGVYILGKAATLNGVRGDVMIPGVVHDEHSQNTYLFQNAFTAGDVAPHLVFSTVLDNQKAVTVLGTFLQNARIMDVVYREGYTDIEMEAGPYLSAVYEMYRPQRHPYNEIVNLYGLPFDLGILHYASDTPLSKGRNLGAGTLSYAGMDCTYAGSVAILRRILQRERERVG